MTIANRIRIKSANNFFPYKYWRINKLRPTNKPYKELCAAESIKINQML